MCISSGNTGRSQTGPLSQLCDITCGIRTMNNSISRQDFDQNTII